ncbi:hypothetical protein [Magnetospirillum moscoviense]|uniref:Uncharacterized protein n=1 Tax=Magnetospirillum moscoviense TaxID=1437059 RepID=A0A178N020_9PROT|nr:hypothetical protein [Magnetospirillum moscoviense]OAN58021.1 hypothetical protein A6A05_07560 [Magnetospirillum moscoviense]
MDKDEVARIMPGIRQGFETLKEHMAGGRMHAAERLLFGGCLQWGAELARIYAADDRAALSARDPLTRFFVIRLRGMPEPASLADAPPAGLFLMAFTAFPYLDALLDESAIGEHHGLDEDGNRLVRRVVAGEDDGTTLRASRRGPDWCFDLMPVYQAKAAAMEAFIEAEFQGDFSAFLWRYVADHDLMFDMDQAWRPLAVEA